MAGSFGVSLTAEDGERLEGVGRLDALRVVLDRLDLAPLFDAVVDGTVVHEAKPHPRVFLVAAERLRVDPFRCAVFEDAQAGIEAAVAAGMTAIGVGNPSVLTTADCTIPGLHLADPYWFGRGLPAPAPGRRSP
jgi:beta-phosphoglucomutase-like phosphatase (HAD superfamily)